MENKITYRKLSEIKELAGNPRTISRSQFEKLKQSVKDNPDFFEQALEFMKNGGNYES